VNTAADHSECPVDPRSLNDDVRSVPDTRRSLVVDDTADTREMFALYFRSRGFTVETASSGRAAIDAAHRLHPDVIVTDVAMPDLDGISATRQIKQDPHTVDIPIVILTAYPIRAIKGGALEPGARFVMKPCAPEELEEQVSSVLAPQRSVTTSGADAGRPSNSAERSGSGTFGGTIANLERSR
jgi:CheY-like chemotaxis protein